MGSGVETCYNAPNMALLGWAAPVSSLRGGDLPPGRWIPFKLAALAASPYNHVLITPDWLPGLLGSELTGSLYISYRAPVGCDVGLRYEHVGSVQVHSYVNTNLMWMNNTYLMVSPCRIAVCLFAATAVSCGIRRWFSPRRSAGRCLRTRPGQFGHTCVTAQFARAVARCTAPRYTWLYHVLCEERFTLCRGEVRQQ
jgi:hypothetical protein